MTDNPHPQPVQPTSGVVSDWMVFGLQTAAHIGWEEGRIAGKAEAEALYWVERAAGWDEGYDARDEVVDALVEACERAGFVLHSSTGNIGLDTAAELRAALAKAKGE